MSRNAVLLIADELQFAPAVFLADRLARLRANRKIDIILATNSPTELAKAREYGGPFELMDISGLHLDLDLPPTAYFTRATYLSLFVPALLAGRYDRLLYIDIDTYPESDRVFALFDLDLGRYPIAAIRDLTVPFFPNPFNGEELMETLRIPAQKCMGAKYLNSGVLLMDLRAYRRDRFDSEAQKVIRDRKVRLRLPDQTVFNAMLRTKWLELSPAFNMITMAWASFIARFAPPVIVHFTGQVKPWHRAFLDDHPVREALPAFLKDTPWSTFIADINRPVNLLGGGPLPPKPEAHRPIWSGEQLAALVNFLRTTKFADADQGITTLDYGALPAVA